MSALEEIEFDDWMDENGLNDMTEDETKDYESWLEDLCDNKS